MKKFLKISLSIALGLPMVAAADTVMLKYKTQAGQDITIKASQLEEMRKKLPPEIVAKVGKDKILTVLRDQELATLLLKDAAMAAGLENDQKVQEMAKKLLESAVVNTYIGREVEKRITDAARQKIYKEVIEPMKNQRNYDISIIQAKDMADGQRIIQLLDSGKDFGATAKMNSIQKETAAQNGKVGAVPEMFLSQAFGPDLLKAISTLKDGKYSKQVVKSPDGRFFVVMLNGSRMAQIPPLDKIKSELDEVLSKKALLEIIMDLKAKAEKASRFSTFDANGKPQAPTSLAMPQAPAPAAE
jgi:peptidyl-prolyl cis-trans isomerase C